MTLTELKKELDKKKVRNLYVFTGPEREMLLTYILKIAGKAENICKVSSLKTAMGYMTSTSLFKTERKVYVVEDDKFAAEADIELISNSIPKDVTLILVFKELNKNTKLFKSKFTTLFDKLKDAQLIKLVVQELGECDERLAAVIVQYCGNDVGRIKNECQKLKFCDKEINLDLVNDVIAVNVDDCIFAMIDAVASKKKLDAYEYYRDLVYLKESPIKIISILYNKFKQIFLVQCNYQLQNVELITKTGLTNFQIMQARNFIQSFSPDTLLYNLRETQRLEVAIKTGKIDQYVGMDNLLINILR